MTEAQRQLMKVADEYKADIENPQVGFLKKLWAAVMIATALVLIENDGYPLH